MVYKQQRASAQNTAGAGDEEGAIFVLDDEEISRRPGVVCLVGAGGTGKTYLARFMASNTRAVLATEAVAGATPAFLEWLDKLVVVVINFNADFQISEMEAKLVADGLFTFKELCHLRLLYQERANLQRSRRRYFRDFVKAVNFALREGVLTPGLIDEEVTNLLIERVGRGGEDDPMVIIVDEVAKLAATLGGPISILQQHIAQNRTKYRTRDGSLPSVVALVVSAACQVADGCGGSVMSTSTDSRLLREGATVVSGRGAPHYNGLNEDPECCIPMCLAALKSLAMKGLYPYSKEINSTELARVLQADYSKTRPALSPRGEELLTPIARSLAFAAGGHPRTVVEVCCQLATATVGEDVSSLLSGVVTDEFVSALDALWEKASEKDRNDFLATLILAESVDTGESCFPSVPSTEQVEEVAAWSWACRCGFVYGVGSTIVPWMSPIMLRRLLRRRSSSSLLFYKCLKQQVEGGSSPSWMAWEMLCSSREWAHSIARSLRPGSYEAVTLGSLFGKNSTYCGDGLLLNTVLVNASHARVGVSHHNLQTLLSWEGTARERELLDQVWLLTEGTVGVDAIMFFRCVRCTYDPTLSGKLIVVGMQCKFKNLLADEHKAKQGLLSTEVIYKNWKNMPTPDAFGSFWEKWRGRFVTWTVVNKEAQASFDMSAQSRTNPECASASIVTTKKDLPLAFGDTIYKNLMAPGVLLKCVVQRY